MKKLAKQFLSLTLSLIMVLSIAPFGSLTGIATEAKAAGVSHYNGIVAAKWAEDHLNDSWSYLVGKGYYDPKDGGDCANFVSQCIYMGGMDMNKFWNYNGYLRNFRILIGIGLPLTLLLIQAVTHLTFTKTMHVRFRNGIIE